MKTLWLALLCCVSAIAQPSPLDAFPKAEDGQQRMVIDLPRAEDEDRLKVELIVGKKVNTDGVNRYFFGGTVEELPLKGWGYTYYQLKELGHLVSTRIGVDAPSKPAETFVKVNHSLPLLRYNSRMPIVVYVPQGVEVRYRIWRAGEEVSAKHN